MFVTMMDLCFAAEYCKQNTYSKCTSTRMMLIIVFDIVNDSYYGQVIHETVIFKMTVA